MNLNVSCVNIDMGLRTSFDVLSRVVEEYESRGWPVRNVEAKTVESTPGRLEATLQLPVSFCPAPNGDAGTALEPTAATPTGSDGVRIEFSTPVLDGLDAEIAEAVTASVKETVVTDGGVLLTLELVVDPERSVALERPKTNGHGTDDARRGGDDPQRGTESPLGETTASDGSVTTDSTADDTGATTAESHDDDGAPTRSEGVEATADGRDPALVADLDTVRDPSLPAYEDTDYLETLYDSCGTFAEMNRYLEMDVSTETVRRYMIDAGVHAASSYGTAESEDRPAGDGGADGRTDLRQLELEHLPEGVTADDLVDAVESSVSLHQVQRRLDLDRRTTRRLLEEFDLLEFVLHRIGADPRAESSAEDIVQRIERARAGRNGDPPVA